MGGEPCVARRGRPCRRSKGVSVAYSPADATATLTISCSSKSRLVLNFLVLPFWYLLTRVDPDIFHTSSKTVVCVCVLHTLVWDESGGPGKILWRWDCKIRCSYCFGPLPSLVSTETGSGRLPDWLWNQSRQMVPLLAYLDACALERRPRPSSSLDAVACDNDRST